MRFAVQMLHTPLAVLIRVGMAYLFVELIVTMIAARRAGGTWKSVRRAAFGQPSWWQPWYPRVLRDPASVWDRMPFSMKLMRTVLWLNLVAIPYALPLIFVVPNLTLLSEASARALPLPLRLVIAFSSVIKWPLIIGLLLVPIAAVIIARSRCVSSLTVLRLLLTWRGDKWDTPEGRRLLAESPR